jgi:hypothetical protein
VVGGGLVLASASLADEAPAATMAVIVTIKTHARKSMVAPKTSVQRNGWIVHGACACWASGPHGHHAAETQRKDDEPLVIFGRRKGELLEVDQRLATMQDEELTVVYHPGSREASGRPQSSRGAPESRGVEGHGGAAGRGLDGPALSPRRRLSPEAVQKS